MILLQFLGVFLMFGLFALAFLGPLIAKEMVIQKLEKEEEKSPFVHICRCEECGYNGRISPARNRRYIEFLKQIVWECPKCGEIIWHHRVKYVLREHAATELEWLNRY